MAKEKRQWHHVAIWDLEVRSQISDTELFRWLREATAEGFVGAVDCLMAEVLYRARAAEAARLDRIERLKAMEAQMRVPGA